jgi:hypothetical protein
MSSAVGMPPAAAASSSYCFTCKQKPVRVSHLRHLPEKSTACSASSNWYKAAARDPWSNYFHWASENKVYLATVINSPHLQIYFHSPDTYYSSCCCCYFGTTIGIVSSLRAIRGLQWAWDWFGITRCFYCYLRCFLPVLWCLIYGLGYPIERSVLRPWGWRFPLWVVVKYLRYHWDWRNHRRSGNLWFYSKDIALTESRAPRTNLFDSSSQSMDIDNYCLQLRTQIPLETTVSLKLNIKRVYFLLFLPFGDSYFETVANLPTPLPLEAFYWTL